MNGDPFNQQRVNFPVNLRRSMAIGAGVMIPQVEMIGKPGLPAAVTGNVVSPVLMFRGTMDLRPVLYAEYRTTVIGSRNG